MIDAATARKLVEERHELDKTFPIPQSIQDAIQTAASNGELQVLVRITDGNESSIWHRLEHEGYGVRYAPGGGICIYWGETDDSMLPSGLTSTV